MKNVRLQGHNPSPPSSASSSKYRYRPHAAKRHQHAHEMAKHPSVCDSDSLSSTSSLPPHVQETTSRQHASAVRYVRKSRTQSCRTEPTTPTRARSSEVGSAFQRREPIFVTTPEQCRYGWRTTSGWVIIVKRLSDGMWCGMRVCLCCQFPRFWWRLAFVYTR